MKKEEVRIMDLSAETRLDRKSNRTMYKNRRRQRRGMNPEIPDRK